MIWSEISDEAYEAMESVLKEIEWGNPGFEEDTCPQCANTQEQGHEEWCRVGKALAHATAARIYSESALEGIAREAREHRGKMTREQ